MVANHKTEAIYQFSCIQVDLRQSPWSFSAQLCTTCKNETFVCNIICENLAMQVQRLVYILHPCLQLYRCRNDRRTCIPVAFISIITFSTCRHLHLPIRRTRSRNHWPIRIRPVETRWRHRRFRHKAGCDRQNTFTVLVYMSHWKVRRDRTDGPSERALEAQRGELMKVHECTCWLLTQPDCLQLHPIFDGNVYIIILSNLLLWHSRLSVYHDRGVCKKRLQLQQLLLLA